MNSSMKYATAMRIRKLALAGSLLTSSGLALAETDAHYLQLSVIATDGLSANQSASGPAGRTQFWKFVVDGEQIQLFDLCSAQPGKTVGNATGTARSWSATINGQRIAVVIDDEHRATVTMQGTPYAEGIEIAEVGCDAATRMPSSQPVMKTAASPTVPSAPITTPGFALMEAAKGKTLMVDVAVTPTPGRPETTDAIPAGTLRCSAAPVTETTVRALTDSPALSRNPQLWPGNLIQGKHLQEGQFTPITARRAGGTLTISGLTFEGPDAMTSIDISDRDRMRESTVSTAINKLLSQKILNTQSTSTFLASAVYSSEQMAFAMGVDGRFSTVSFKASMSVDTSGKKNTVLARFTQIYYTVDFEDPETRYSVFADGRDFDVEDDQLGGDNPPLYVKQVSYGRTIYFLASSTESSTAIKAALEGAYGNKDAGNFVGANANTSYQSVMANTSVAYFVMGGDAVTALTPITADDPAKMYDAVKQVIANHASAEVGAANRGLPVAYSINYLTNRAPASMGYATSYDRTDCTIIPTAFYSYAMEQTCVDDSVTVSVIDNTDKESPVVNMGAGFSGREFVNLDQFLPQKDQDVKLRIQAYNIAGPWCSNYKLTRTFKNPQTGVFETLYLQPDGRLGASDAEITRGGDWLVGTRSDQRILLNRATGTVQVLQ
jgi:hypothetical protein